MLEMMVSTHHKDSIDTGVVLLMSRNNKPIYEMVVIKECQILVIMKTGLGRNMIQN